jgi:hypothetical protein
MYNTRTPQSIFFVRLVSELFLRPLKLSNIIMNTKAKIVFFGGEPIGVPILQKLYEAGIVPDLVVCSPDRQGGGGGGGGSAHVLTPG